MNDLISRRAAEIKLKELVNEMETIFADIREREVDDSVCGLCEYDCDHGLDGYANECPGFERNDCFKLKDKYRKEWTNTSDIPSVTPERKKGKWMLWNEPGYEHAYCTACKEQYDQDDLYIGGNEYPKYCPNCGAEMEVKE